MYWQIEPLDPCRLARAFRTLWTFGLNGELSKCGDTQSPNALASARH
jgi:hypothetical protein